MISSKKSLKHKTLKDLRHELFNLKNKDGKESIKSKFENNSKILDDILSGQRKSSDKVGLGYKKKSCDVAIMDSIGKKDSHKCAPSSHNKDRTNMMPRRPITSRYKHIFISHCYSCNNFGHMARECKMISPIEKKATIEVKKQRKGWKKKEVMKQKDRRFPKYKRTFYGYCHYCHKFGHKVLDCRIKRKDQGLKRQRNRRSVSRVPHGKIQRKKLDHKDSK